MADMATPAIPPASSIPLPGGTEIPRLGFGVWQTPRGVSTVDAVKTALAAGYRHIDTASIYGNETDVGVAIRDGGVKRESIFVTTKLWNADQGYDKALRGFERSLGRLKLEYVDLYLMHWPVPELRLESWRALERIHAEGRARAIGVSNFLQPHLAELLASAQTRPAVDQIELSPFLQRADTVAYCRQHGIVLAAYSPLTHGLRLGHPGVIEVAAAVRRSSAQVLIRWGLQKGFVVLPKSARAERIAENAAVFDFELDPGAMQALDALEEGLATGWDPADEA
jgi:diketogulonate reductase-like aldo/keto reductase